jgi:hypothetical protein
LIFSKLKNNNFFKKIFNIRRSPKKHNKTMEKIADFLHGSLLFSSVFLFYLFFLDEKILNISLNIPIFLFFSANLYLIHKFSGKDFLQPKPIQRTISHFLNKYSIFLFIIHWIFLSFWAGAGIFVLTTFLAINYIYAVDFLRARPTFDRASFSYSYNHSYNQSSGRRPYSSNLRKEHIKNLFEEDKPFDSLNKEIIKRQYKKIAKKYHPDLYSGEPAKFQSIQESYQFLLKFYPKKV